MELLGAEGYTSAVQKSTNDEDADTENNEEEVENDDDVKGDTAVDTKKKEVDDTGELLVFSCRHIFHRRCLEKLGASVEGNDDSSPFFTFGCIMCR